VAKNVASPSKKKARMAEQTHPRPLICLMSASVHVKA
jgi:hypothetical protein